jgi:hypothetical protein
MDPNLERLKIAQDLIQGLINFLASAVRPLPAAIQALLDDADAKLKVIAAQPTLQHYNVPNVLPPTTGATL